MNSGRFDSGAECLIVINTYLLVNTLSNLSCSVSLHNAIKFALNPLNPLTTDQILHRLGWYQFPCVISNQSIVLLRHNLPPIWNVHKLV